MAAELATGRSLPDELTEQVLERSGGNPLFLEELLHGERGAGRREPRRLPASIHEMLLARLDALPAESRRTLQLASVVGMEFDERSSPTSRTRTPSATEDALRSLQRAELVQVRGDAAADRSFVFRHPLIHEVAYGSLLTSTRRAMHGRSDAGWRSTAARTASPSWRATSTTATTVGRRATTFASPASARTP